jgi:hypothetical protein
MKGGRNHGFKFVGSNPVRSNPTLVTINSTDHLDFLQSLVEGRLG